MQRINYVNISYEKGYYIVRREKQRPHEKPNCSQLQMNE